MADAGARGGRYRVGGRGYRRAGFGDADTRQARAHTNRRRRHTRQVERTRIRGVGTNGEKCARKLAGSARREIDDLQFLLSMHTKSGRRHAISADAAKTCAHFSPGVPTPPKRVRTSRQACRRQIIPCTPPASRHKKRPAEKTTGPKRAMKQLSAWRTAGACGPS